MKSEANLLEITPLFK